MKPARFFIAAFALILTFSAKAQTIWNNGGDTFSWSDTANWSTGSIPIPTSAVQIGTQPSFDTVVVDTGATIVASFTFNNSLTASVDITTSGGGDSLQVNGAIANASSFAQSFSLPVSAGGSATWTGPIAFSNNVSIVTNQITLANAITFSGTNLNFDITNASTYGRFLGAGTATVAGVTINIGGAYTGVANDTFDFTSGNFSGASFILPTLSGGLTWDSSNFLTNGTLTVVVPEPTTWALFATGLAAAMVFRPRRRQF